MNIDTSEIRSGGQLDGLCFAEATYDDEPVVEIWGYCYFQGETYGSYVRVAEYQAENPEYIRDAVEALVGVAVEILERAANRVVETDVTSIALLYMGAMQAGNLEAFLTKEAGRELAFGIDALDFGNRPKKSDEFWLARARRRKEIGERVRG